MATVAYTNTKASPARSRSDCNRCSEAAEGAGRTGDPGAVGSGRSPVTAVLVMVMQIPPRRRGGSVDPPGERTGNPVVDTSVSATPVATKGGVAGGPPLPCPGPLTGEGPHRPMANI